MQIPYVVGWRLTSYNGATGLNATPANNDVNTLTIRTAMLVLPTYIITTSHGPSEPDHVVKHEEAGEEEKNKDD